MFRVEWDAGALGWGELVLELELRTRLGDLPPGVSSHATRARWPMSPPGVG